MQVFSWNLNGKLATPAYMLDALRPDIAFLQEANLLPGFGGPNLIYQKPLDHHWGTALYTAALPLEPIQLPEHNPPDHTGWVVAGRTVLPQGRELILISVHAPLFKSPRMGHVFPYLSDLFQQVIHPFVQGKHFIIGGDLNASRLYGIDHPRSGSGGEPHNLFFDWVESHGFVNCHRISHEIEEQSIWRPRCGPYQDDYLFVSDSLKDYVKCCDVRTTPETRTHSDHSPVVMTMDLPWDR
jgi:exonuclease III